LPRITSPDKDSSTVSVPHQFPAITGAKQPGMVDDFDVSRFVEAEGAHRSRRSSAAAT